MKSCLTPKKKFSKAVWYLSENNFMVKDVKRGRERFSKLRTYIFLRRYFLFHFINSKEIALILGIDNYVIYLVQVLSLQMNKIEEKIVKYGGGRVPKTCVRLAWTPLKSRRVPCFGIFTVMY